MISHSFRFGTLLTAATALPIGAFAGDAWSVASVEQSQSAWAPHHDVRFHQDATILTSNNLGSQATAQAESTGTQDLKFKGRGTQSQQLTASTALSWEDGKWPAEATAHSEAGIEQKQSARSRSPITMKENAQVWGKARVGDTTSFFDVRAHQKNVGAKGTASQKQNLAGATHAEGFVNPPFPPCHQTCHSAWFGGKLVQTVHVFVQNILTF
jgi:hypothetical protein